MRDAAPEEVKLMPPALNKRTLNSNNEPQQTTPQEMECTLANQEKSPPSEKNAPSEMSALESACSFEDTATGTSREISMLASKFAEVLSERAAADYTQMKELEGILTQARNLESYLKEKKRHLRQTLALISDKLMG
uniref:Testis expressed 12 n=1 Tax=Acanthochromis polyacanthus TaxID=80966 RepID=A0A3Q1EXH5_9TELE